MSTNLKARAWVQVRADALRSNYRRVADTVGSDARVLPMVKADAYGLGVRRVVECLEPLDPWGFGVATVEEGLALRDFGVTRPILICSPAPFEAVDEAVRHDLQLSISSLQALERVQDAVRALGRSASVHLDVDTGMGRSGFDWRDASSWLSKSLAPRDRVHVVGIHTHLHSADENDESVVEQWTRFSRILDDIDDGGLMVHVLNSAGVFRAPAHAKTLVRPGIFLYGGEVGIGQPSPEPVASVHARVVHVRDVPAGTTLGYGATYTSAEAERWGTLSIGYGDGLPRALGNRGLALIDGLEAPLIGRISMDVTVVDISDVPGVEEGTVATLLGVDGGSSISVDEVAELAGTISYEVLTGLTPRLPRVWSDSDA